MKIVYTYCQISDEPVNEFTVLMAKLAVCSVNKFTGFETVLYTNVHDFDNLPFSDIQYVDFFTWDWDRRYWNMPKLMTYSVQDSPFVHIDLDICILPLFSLDDKADIICEKTRIIRPDEHPTRHCAAPFASLCSGFMGTCTTKGLDFFKILMEKAMNECRSGMHDSVEFVDLYSIEECYTYHYACMNNMRIYSPPVYHFWHFTGDDKEMRYRPAVEKTLETLGLR